MNIRNQEFNKTHLTIYADHNDINSENDNVTLPLNNAMMTNTMMGSFGLLPKLPEDAIKELNVFEETKQEEI